MNLGKQIQLVSRIQADLRKEAAHHRGNDNPMAATDCSEQATALDDVLRTLRAVASITVAMEVLTANNRISGFEAAHGCNPMP